jgi:hypothetical protein
LFQNGIGTFADLSYHFRRTVLTRRFPFLAAALGLHLLSASLAGFLHAQTSSEPQLLPLRALPKDRAYDLRVLYLEDSRLPTLEARRRAALYAKIERLLDGWYGYHVKLREVGQQGLAEYFSAHEEIFSRHSAKIRNVDIDLASTTGLERLGAAISRDFRPRPAAQIEHYLRTGAPGTMGEAVKVAQEQFLRKLAELREIPARDGKPFYDPARARLTSFVHWALLIEEITEADLVFTNSMIAGADSEMPIYVIARGGLTTGLTDNNPRSPYQGATMVGLFPFLSDAPVFLRERGRIPEDERLDVIATMCLHEMGHLFCRYAEYYDHPHCVQVAPVGLDYYGWHKAIRAAGPCTLEHRTITRF